MARVAGGPPAVDARLKGIGLKYIRNARYIRELLRDGLSIPEPASPPVSLAEQFRKMPPKRAAERRERASRANPEYDADTRDQATPKGMRALLVRIRQADGVSEVVHSALVPLMERAVTGLKRIRGRLPAISPCPGEKAASLLRYSRKGTRRPPPRGKRWLPTPRAWCTITTCFRPRSVRSNRMKQARPCPMQNPGKPPENRGRRRTMKQGQILLSGSLPDSVCFQISKEHFVRSSAALEEQDRNSPVLSKTHSDLSKIG